MRLCTQTGTGQLVDVEPGRRRPPATFTGLRHALLDMVVEQVTVSPAAGRSEAGHDPSPALRAFVQARDRYDDGPTGSLTRAAACHLDHELPWPVGPTAAWNLTARAARTHQLKHYGWTPLRTPTSTLWFSPAGQVVEVPHHLHPAPGADPDPDGLPPELPDPELLALTDLAGLQPRTDQDRRPHTHGLPPDTTTWTWLTEPPF